MPCTYYALVVYEQQYMYMYLYKQLLSYQKLFHVSKPEALRGRLTARPSGKF